MPDHNYFSNLIWANRRNSLFGLFPGSAYKTDLIDQMNKIRLLRTSTLGALLVSRNT
jgi:hypothetical protein